MNTRATNVRISNGQQPDPTSSDLVCEPYDFENLLPISLIREHTNTDDVPHVSDDMLILYRRTALDAAQGYTKLLLTGRQTITEVVKVPLQRMRRRSGWMDSDDQPPPTHIHNTQYSFAQDHAFYYGTNGRFNRRVHVRAGSSKVELPVIHSPFGGGCCDPCGGSDDAHVSHLMYVAGYANECDIPPQIALGCLKYIAHVLENAGDVPMVTTAQGTTGPSNTLLNQASNPALASGAIDIWATVRRAA